MTFADIREHVRSHFQEQLRAFKAGVGVSGPKPPIDVAGMRTSQVLAEGDPAEWSEYTPNGWR